MEPLHFFTNVLICFSDSSYKVAPANHPSGWLEGSDLDTAMEHWE